MATDGLFGDVPFARDDDRNELETLRAEVQRLKEAVERRVEACAVCNMRPRVGTMIVCEECRGKT